MAAGDSSPFHRRSETLLERRGVCDSAEAVPHCVRGEVDVHVPFEWTAFEPIEHLHCGFVEGHLHLEWKVPVDLEDYDHARIENVSRTVSQYDES
jgi:hypothetical protein